MIITKLKGGMGNQMFQYALGRALSVKYKVPLGLDLAYLLDRTPRSPSSNFTFRDYDLDLFNINAEIVSPSKIPFIYRTYKGKIGLYFDYFRRKFLKLSGVEKKLNFNPDILNIGSDSYIDGYWQSPKYFYDVEDIIRKDFTLKKISDENIINLSKQILRENSLCIYVRRRDYVGNSYYEVIDSGYYRRGIEYINKLAKIDNIYLFSDDIEWCKKNIKFEFPTIFVDSIYEGEKYTGYLYLMTFCKYFIIANSSFSWWGAWLSTRDGKVVVSPNKWNNDDFINIDDIIEKEWIKI